jgi:hypothetical protein
VFSKVEKQSTEDGKDEKKEPTDTKLFVSKAVEYQGTSAMTIAFLKREPYKNLILQDQIKAATAGGEDNLDEDHVDISSQLQVINMGYIGQDSNIFELASTYVDFSILPLF